MTDVLVERGGRDVALSVAQNSGAKFSETGYVRLVKRSEHDEELARSVGSRPEIPRHHFLKLLSTASKAVRMALEGAHPEHAGEIQHVVAKVTTAIQAKAAATSRDYAAARARVETLRASGELGEGDLATFAQAGSFEDTAVVLATLSALPIDVVERVLVQDRAETILIVAKVDGTVVADGERRCCCCAPERAACPPRRSNSIWRASCGSSARPRCRRSSSCENARRRI